MRVLATAAGSFSLAVFAANCIPLLEGALLPLSCALAALCAVALLCLRGRARVRGALICGGLALGLLWTAAYGAVFYAPARALDDRTIRLSGTVMEYPQETDYGWSVLVRADGEPGAPVPTLVYADEQGADLRPGDRVETVAHCTLAERTFGGEEITYYTAKGIFLRAEAYGELRVTRPERLPLRYLPAELAHQLKQGVDAAFPEDAAPLIRALTTGNRDNLTDHYTSSLQRTGLSHTVAVSGMHLSFLAALVSGLLGRGKRRSALVTCGVVLVFTLISGCTPSVVRAAVMLILLQLAALLGRERDPLTALALALMLLLAWNPFSAAHIGLQLSFASVAGILLFSDRLQERMLRGWKRPPKDSIPLRLLGALVRFGAAALSATLGAMVFTTPLTALYFGSLSLISPLANLMTLWAVSAAFSGGLIAGAAGAVLPELGRVLALPVLPFVRYLDWVVPRLARAPFAWSKAMPALCPIVLAGFWYLYRQTLLPRFWYQHQQELYLAVWTMAGVLALLPCLKRRHWGMLLPVLAMMLACLGFRGMLAYPQVYSLFSGRLMEEKAEMSTQYYLRFGQPSEELAVAALLVAAVYLLCCFLRVEWVSAEQKGRQEPEES